MGRLRDGSLHCTAGHIGHTTLQLLFQMRFAAGCAIDSGKLRRPAFTYDLIGSGTGPRPVRSPADRLGRAIAGAAAAGHDERRT